MQTCDYKWLESWSLGLTVCIEKKVIGLAIASQEKVKRLNLSEFHAVSSRAAFFFEKIRMLSPHHSAPPSLSTSSAPSPSTLALKSIIDANDGIFPSDLACFHFSSI
jgi:hypothetical protein